VSGVADGAVREMSSKEQPWRPGRNWLPRRREMTKCIKDNRKIKQALSQDRKRKSEGSYHGSCAGLNGYSAVKAPRC